ncbi:hypothetical protein [Polymorphobacter multimanifer]|uniref:ABC transporter permease n=1 Tax=Polymorphobacter multimanifer TaxID=1070431 RepID=A0A841LHU6_9SPHN|nr:hypothetical protein [Polymorphobacter multimanifer]MBB6228772.1 hypothetical protein [Polymorphobacter multimanifer]
MIWRRVLDYLKELRSAEAAQWDILPKWLQILTYALALPAWLYLASGIMSGEPRSGLGADIAIGLFVSTGVLQIVLIIRAYWRGDIL